MAQPRRFPPVVGDWFEGRDGLFEVVALDESEGSIEIQHVDGSVEEIELDDWTLRCKAGSLRHAEQPEDYSGAIDAESDSPFADGADSLHWVDDIVNTRGLDGLDLFE
ncbi:MAG: hypothetical protein RLZZ200_539 [Pseudomonadota bacterium]|jgi:hypothetical protein